MKLGADLGEFEIHMIKAHRKFSKKKNIYCLFLSFLLLKVIFRT